MYPLRSTWLASILLIACLPDAAAQNRALHRQMLIPIAVTGPVDERLTGGANRADNAVGTSNARHLARALRVSFPLRGSLAVTATPVCFADTILTVAHVIKPNGDATADPRGLQVALPRLDHPGRFSDAIAVRDYRLAHGSRRLPDNGAATVSEDFMLLQLTHDLPESIEPLTLSIPPADADSQDIPHCDRPSVNAAYHDDLGWRDGSVARVQPGPLRVQDPGRVPLLTFADGIRPRTDDPEAFGDWYRGPFIGLTHHDTASSASGSAIVCPDDDTSARNGDRLLGIVVGEARGRPMLAAGPDSQTGPSSRDLMRNIVNINLQGMLQALAALKAMPVEAAARACSRSQHSAAAGAPPPR